MCVAHSCGDCMFTVLESLKLKQNCLYHQSLSFNNLWFWILNHIFTENESQPINTSGDLVFLSSVVSCSLTCGGRSA